MLYIAEKPEVARAIVDALGGAANKTRTYIDLHNGDSVTWCLGHILEHQNPDEINKDYKSWNMAHLPMNLPLPIPLKPIPRAKAQLNTIEKLLTKHKEVTNCCDADAEGSLLGTEVLVYFGYRGKTYRAPINDLNPTAIRKVLDAKFPNEQDKPNYYSALGRSNFDYVYGLNLTRCCTLLGRENGYNSVLSVGRVQLAFLSMILTRQRLNESHVKSPFYDIVIPVERNGNLYKFRINAKQELIDKYPDAFDDKKRIINKGLAEQLLNLIKSFGFGTVTEVSTDFKQVQPPLPYSLLNLQRDASRIFGIDIDQTLKISQSLRETHHLTTYNRTDCPYLPVEHSKNAPDTLNFISRLLPNLNGAISIADPHYVGRCFNDKKITAHHAISPVVTNKSNLSDLSDDESKIYFLICRSYLAQFMPLMQRTQYRAIMEIGQFKFKATSSRVTDEGWRALFKSQNDKTDSNDDADNEPDLSVFASGDSIDGNNAILQEGFTNPLPLYTLDTFLKDLTNAAKYVEDPRLKKILIEKDADGVETGGIGTPATRASIIKTLFDRPFIQMKGKNIIGTKIGHEYFDALPGFMTKPDLTAYWQDLQNQLMDGSLSVDQFFHHVDSFVENCIQQVKKIGINIKSVPKIHTSNEVFNCPNCDQPLRHVANKNFWGCTGYPNCKSSFPNIGGKPDLTPKPKAFAEKSNYNCPKCDSPMIKRKSDKGFWFGCSNYPKCKCMCNENNGKLVIIEKKKRTKKLY